MSKLSEFESEFAESCRKSHQVYATLESRTVERQNARPSKNAVRYKPEMKYAYMRYGCILTEVFQEVLGLGLEPAVCIAIASNTHGWLCALLTFAKYTAGHTHRSIAYS